MEDNHTPAVEPANPPIPPRRRSRWVLPVVLLAVLVVVSLMTLFAWGILTLMRTDMFKGAMGQAQVAAKCQVQLQTIGAAFQRYEISHGEYPPTLDALYPDYLPSRSVLRCPADSRDANSGPPSYTYIKPPDKAPPDTIVCVCNRHRIMEGQPPMQIFLRKDGQVSMAQPTLAPPRGK